MISIELVRNLLMIFFREIYEQVMISLRTLCRYIVILCKRKKFTKYYCYIF